MIKLNEIELKGNNTKLESNLYSYFGISSFIRNINLESIKKFRF